VLDAIDWTIVIWLVAGALSVVGELLTGTLLLMPFAIGAVVAAIAVALGADPMLTFAVFAAVSLSVLAVVLRFGKRLAAEPAATHEGAHRYVGARGVVTRPIAAEDAGQVRVRGELWRALAHAHLPIEPDVRVTVIEIRGNALVVEPIQFDEDGSG